MDNGSIALVATGLTMGLVGSPHCAGMCGALCAGIAQRRGAPLAWRDMLAFHLARAASYALGGALAAGSVGLLKGWGEQVAVLRPFWVLMQVAAAVLGAWLLWRGQAPRWPATGRRPTWQAVMGPGRPAAPHAQWGTPFAWGLAWVAWPCGLLHSALLVAALAPGAAAGAAVMLAFAAASAAALCWGLLLPSRSDSGTRAQSRGTRLSGLLLMASAAWGLFHGTGLATGFC